MGDVAMTVPVIYSLAKQYPHVRITVLSRSFARPFFENLAPNVGFMEADLKGNKGVKGLNALYRRLIAKQFTAIADLHSVLRSRLSAHALQPLQLQGGTYRQASQGKAQAGGFLRQGDGETAIFLPELRRCLCQVGLSCTDGFHFSLPGRRRRPELLLNKFSRSLLITARINPQLSTRMLITQRNLG